MEVADGGYNACTEVEDVEVEVDVVRVVVRGVEFNLDDFNFLEERVIE